MNYKNPELSTQERVDDLLARMSLSEKIAQLAQISVTARNRVEVIQRIRETGLGSRILADSNLAGNGLERAAEIEDLNELQRTAVEESRLGIPLLHGRDVIHGYRTIFPIPLGLAASCDPELVEESFAIAGGEASSAGMHWSFAPMLDTSRDPRWGRIIESFGEDPWLAARLAEAAVAGFQDKAGILACAKHYIGYGAAESGRDYNTAEISDNSLRNVYLPPFKAAVRAGVGSVMSGFHDLNGEAVSASRYLLSDVLRDELGFEGFIVSDWGSVSDLLHHRVAADRREAGKLAFNAGVDMEMVSDCYYEHLANLVKTGEVEQKAIDDSVRRILTAKFKLGLFEQPYARREEFEQRQFTPANQAAARRAAAASMVLLKNNGLLPIPKGGKKIAVIGPFADQRRALLGSWSIDGLIDETPTLLEAMRQVFDADEIVTCSSGLTDEILISAAGADLVVMAVGESNARNGENNCVASLALPAGQAELVKAVAGLGKPVALLVFAGRPVLLTELVPLVDAILYAWHPGSMGAFAAADLLSGDAQPSAKLPVSFPRADGQIPAHYNRKSTGKAYFKYLDMPAEPLYPFGYGLTYTRFSFSEIQLSRASMRFSEQVEVSVMVTNSGERDGQVTAQCYIQDVVSRLTRPIRELKGFQKIELKAGETRRVSFKLGSDELSYYGVGGKWTLEPGEFKVWIGEDSRASLAESFWVVE